MKKFVPIVLFVIFAVGCGGKPELNTGENISRAEILLLHNKERQKKGAEQLKKDETLQKYAQNHAEWMASRNSLTHSRLNLGTTKFNAMGENIAEGYESIEDVIHGWMTSTGHRRNILNKSYTHAGFGYARKGDGNPYWCAVFGGE